MTQPTKAKAKTKAPLTLHGKLLESIGTVDRPGTYCTSSDLPLVMPGPHSPDLVVTPRAAHHTLDLSIYCLHHVSSAPTAISTEGNTWDRPPKRHAKTGVYTEYVGLDHVVGHFRRFRIET